MRHVGADGNRGTKVLRPCAFGGYGVGNPCGVSTLCGLLARQPADIARGLAYHLPNVLDAYWGLGIIDQRLWQDHWRKSLPNFT